MSDRRIWRPKKATNPAAGNLVRLRGQSDGLLDGAEVDWDVISGDRPGINGQGLRMRNQVSGIDGGRRA